MENDENLFDILPFPSGEVWDRPMSEEEWRKLSWQAKHLRSVTSRGRKIALLRRWANNPEELAVVTCAIPQKRPALREWEDPEQGLWKWSDVKIDQPIGKNLKAMSAFKSAIDAINGASARKSQTSRNQKDIINRLEMQVAGLLEEVRRLRRKLYGPLENG